MKAIKKAKSIKEVLNHPSVGGHDTEEQFGELFYFINLKKGFRNDEEGTHSIHASKEEIVKYFNSSIARCSCEECNN